MGLQKRSVIMVIGGLFIAAVIITAIVAITTRKESVDTPASRNIETRIAITQDGFTPATVTIEKGMTVVWSNDTAEPHQVGANPYPDGSSLPSLRSETLAPGDTYSYTFSETGTYGYTDYTHPTTGGTVQVKQR